MEIALLKVLHLIDSASDEDEIYGKPECQASKAVAKYLTAINAEAG